jgi:nicotinamidase-related amidase
MPKLNKNLHGNVTGKSRVALLLIDVINDLEFPGNELLLKHAPRMADRIAALKVRAAKAKIPTIYVNDNFGKWRSDFQKQVDHCLHDNVCGKIVTEKLKPAPEDYFVLKPKHSGFFASSLDLLLRAIEAETLILTGIAGDRCVLFTASDAYLRDYKVFVPSDCTVSNSPILNREALKLMQRVLRADIKPSQKINLNRLQQSTR